MTAYVLLGAVVVGWMIQLYLSYRQSMAFNDQVRRIRSDGTVSVGVAGRRYRGGRAYVAIAVDAEGIVRNVITLSGWTTFARGRALPALFDAKVSQVRGNKEFTGVTRQQREAARQAAALLHAQARTRSKQNAGHGVEPGPTS